MLSAERPHRDYELPVRRRRVSMLKRMSISAAPAASVSAAAVNAPASVAAAPRSAFNNIMDEDAAASALLAASRRAGEVPPSSRTSAGLAPTTLVAAPAPAPQRRPSLGSATPKRSLRRTSSGITSPAAALATPTGFERFRGGEKKPAASRRALRTRRSSMASISSSSSTPSFSAPGSSAAASPRFDPLARLSSGRSRTQQQQQQTPQRLRSVQPVIPEEPAADGRRAEEEKQRSAALVRLLSTTQSGGSSTSSSSRRGGGGGGGGDADDPIALECGTCGSLQGCTQAIMQQHSRIACSRCSARIQTKHARRLSEVVPELTTTRCPACRDLVRHRPRLKVMCKCGSWIETANTRRTRTDADDAAARGALDLLGWCQRMTAVYRALDEPPVANLKVESWADGVDLCCIVCRACPEAFVAIEPTFARVGGAGAVRRDVRRVLRLRSGDENLLLALRAAREGLQVSPAGRSGLEFRELLLRAASDGDPMHQRLAEDIIFSFMLQILSRVKETNRELGNLAIIQPHMCEAMLESSDSRSARHVLTSLQASAAGVSSATAACALCLCSGYATLWTLGHIGGGEPSAEVSPWSSWTPASCSRASRVGCSCERTSAGVLHEASSAYSSLAFIVVASCVLLAWGADFARMPTPLVDAARRAAVWQWHFSARSYSSSASIEAWEPVELRTFGLFATAFAGGLALLGFGSMLFHASTTFAGQAAADVGALLALLATATCSVLMWEGGSVAALAPAATTGVRAPTDAGAAQAPAPPQATAAARLRTDFASLAKKARTGSFDVHRDVQQLIEPIAQLIAPVRAGTVQLRNAALAVADRTLVFTLSTGAATAAGAAVVVALPSLRYVPAGAAAATALLSLAATGPHARWWATAAVVLFAIALASWFTDATRLVCGSLDAWVHYHTVWHAACALAFGCLFGGVRASMLHRMEQQLGVRLRAPPRASSLRDIRERPYSDADWAIFAFSRERERLAVESQFIETQLVAAADEVGGIARGR